MQDKQAIWEGSEFQEVIRLTKDDKDFLRKNKGKKSMAGFLHAIIQEFKNNQEKYETSSTR